MTGLLKKLHIFFLFYGCFVIYQRFEESDQKVKELYDRVPGLQRQLKKAKRDKKNLERYFTDIEEAKERIEKVAKGIEKLQKKLPATISDTENLAILRGIAEDLNLKNLLLSPGEEIIKGFFVSKNYRVRGSGTFLQFLILLEKIGEQERILNVKTVQFKGSKKQRKGRFQLIDAEIDLEAFRFNERFKENRGIKDIEHHFKKRPKKKKQRKRRKK
jgi:Tfp pilus assembly protein PilO